MPNEFIVDTILPKLNLSSDIISDIQTVINQGKEVTTHTNNVSVPGWSGAGYIIIDPKTGDGAYLISGGANGGNMQPPLDNEDRALNALVLVVSARLGFFLDKSVESIGLAIATYIITTLLIKAMLVTLAGTLIASAGLLPLISMFIAASVAGLAILISNTLLSINNIYYFKKINYV